MNELTKVQRASIKPDAGLKYALIKICSRFGKFGTIAIVSVFLTS